MAGQRAGHLRNAAQPAQHGRSQGQAAAFLPEFSVPGNHEIECDNASQLPFLPYEHYFRNANRLGAAEIAAIDPNYRQSLWNHSCSTPSNFLGSYNFGNAFYQFQHGLVQIIILSSYSDTRPESMQYMWLEGVLKGIDRSVTPWILVGFQLEGTLVGLQ